MYEVIADFIDLQDKNHPYKVGDKFPRKGKVKKERLEELITTKNKFNTRFIKSLKEGE